MTCREAIICVTSGSVLINPFSSEEQMEKNRKEYAAEKARKYKIRLINEWRAKQK